MLHRWWKALNRGYLRLMFGWDEKSRTRKWLGGDTIYRTLGIEKEKEA